MATTYNLSPVYQGPQLTNSGALLVGGKIYWYLAGTSTPVTVYQNAAGSAAHTQPIILDARGEAPAPIYLASGQKYKAVLQDSTGSQLQVIDNIIGVGDTAFASTSLPSLIIDSTGNGARLFQGASGDLEILTNLTSGTSGLWKFTGTTLTFPDTTTQATSPGPIATTAEMQAGSVTDPRIMTPKLVSQAIASLSASPNKMQTFLSSGTFTPSVSGTYKVFVIGGGGSGGANCSTSGYGASSGGAAGGMAIKSLTLSSSTTYTVTVGAGGAATATITSGTAQGNAGGTTSFSGSGITTVSATGGGGGLATNSANSVSGATGGTATGGDYNYTGGGSGVPTVTTGGTCNAATGGGAVSLYGNAYASGSASATGTGAAAASGGAGVGGNSGSATGASSSAVSAGGGVGSASSNSTGTTGITPAAACAISAFPFVVNGSSGYHTGTANDPLLNGGSGAGGAGSRLTTTSSAGAGGAFAGGGAAVSSGGSSQSYSGPGGIGAGSGGVAAVGTSNSATAAAGGSGAVFILWVA